MGNGLDCTVILPWDWHARCSAMSVKSSYQWRIREQNIGVTYHSTRDVVIGLMYVAYMRIVVTMGDKMLGYCRAFETHVSS